MPDLSQPSLPPVRGLEDSGFPDSTLIRHVAAPDRPLPLLPLLVPRSGTPMSGVERLVWAVLVLLTLCPAVGFLLAWWLG